MKLSKINKQLVWLLVFTGCSVWNEEFEDKAVRAYPKASVHKLSTMVDKGIIKESEPDLTTELKLSKDTGAYNKVYNAFTEGQISRSLEDVRRIYVSTYEDASKNLHMSHYLYFVLNPSGWRVK